MSSSDDCFFPSFMRNQKNARFIFQTVNGIRFGWCIVCSAAIENLHCLMWFHSVHFVRCVPHVKQSHRWKTKKKSHLEIHFTNRRVQFHSDCKPISQESNCYSLVSYLGFNGMHLETAKKKILKRMYVFLTMHKACNSMIGKFTKQLRNGSSRLQSVYGTRTAHCM